MGLTGTDMPKLDGIAVASIVGGTVFAYAGITGRSVLGSIQAVVSGKSPSAAPQANSITGQGTGNPDALAVGNATIQGGSVSGTALAQTASSDVGHAYKYGGAPGADGKSPWDCSSSCNWWINKKMGAPIPGYGGNQWNPTGHGPATGSYSGFGTKVPRGSVQAGDICLWATHMGIALNNTQMVSALNERLGTQITGIENGGPQGESVTFHRIG